MAENTTLVALQHLDRILLSALEGRRDDIDFIEDDGLLAVFEAELEKLWTRPPRSNESRNAVNSGKIEINGEEYTVNDEFKQTVLNFSDEVEINELEAADIVLASQNDPVLLGRSLLECAIIRLHQHRKYVLNIIRILVDLASDEGSDEGSESAPPYDLANRILHGIVFSNQNSQRIVPRCMAAMRDVRVWLQKINDKITAAAVLSGGQAYQASEELETIEFSRVSLIQQHELMSTVMSQAIDWEPKEEDFKALLSDLRAADRYDSLLVHRIPLLATFISKFGSPDLNPGLAQVRRLHAAICPPDPERWVLPYLQAAFRVWWLAEYGGHYLDDIEDETVVSGANLDKEEEERSRQFLDSLKDGAFDFMLSVAADVKSVEWQDPARMGMRSWLQRKSPHMPTDTVTFSEPFQTTLMKHLEGFADAFITHLPNVLRKLRIDEDEQRQLSQTHEHDLNLERFLIIIAYSYEGRPDSGGNFWGDEESNLAGFMTWASRRASTPLVTAFCEMLQAISENEENATSAHQFLLDEGSHGSGKLRRSLSLTWSQIFKELVFFSEKLREKPAPTQPTYHPGKPNAAQVEAEPESAMMLECYLRLITKLATESETVRLFLIQHEVGLVDVLFQLASRQIPPRLRACTFWALGALVSRKAVEEGYLMWTSVDNWTTGFYSNPPGGQGTGYPKPSHAPAAAPERVLEEISHGFEEPYAFILLLTSLVTPVEDASPLSDSLPFPENLGSSYRMPGIDSFVDYVLGDVLSKKTEELTDKNQARMLRLQCLDFAVVCLESFNENLIILANSTNLPIDSAMATSDLPTYVRMHPFARVMDWMLTEKAVKAMFSAIHQPIAEVGNAPPDSPLILGILRAITLITCILDLQPTYLNIIRPIIRNQSNYRRLSGSTSRYSSFEDGLVGHLDLVVDLGNFCGLGHPDLSLACLKLLERISVSSRITSAWSANIGARTHRNKAIVSLEANGDHEAISRSLMSDLEAPLDPGREMDSPVYLTKIYILDFLYACLRESPRKPSIAHLLLGFQCEVDSVTVEPSSPFYRGSSVFRSLIDLWSLTHPQDGSGVRQWLVALEYRVLRILQILWTSPMTAPIVIDELRAADFVFALLAKESPILPGLLWEGQAMPTLEFPLTDGAVALTEFLSHRTALFNYLAMELCSVSQERSPTYKRRIFEALRGTVVVESQETISVSSIFELFDFILPTSDWQLAEPTFHFYTDLDLDVCVDDDSDGNRTYNVERVREILLVKRSEARGDSQVIVPLEAALIDREENAIIEYLVSSNRQTQIVAQSHKLLKAWVNLVLIMIESNDFQGSARTSFYLETLQTILPSLEVCASERQHLAYELAKLAKVLLFKLDLTPPGPADSVAGKGAEMSHLVGDKLYQLFQICLQAIGKWADQSELRSVYYSICYRYLTGMVDKESAVLGRQKTMRTIQIYGDRLANVICDDAYGGEPGCQTSALILLSALVNLGSQEDDSSVVDTLSRVNFIGVLVDSLKGMMREGAEGMREQSHCHDAKLALLLRLCQTKEGAKYVLHANLFRAVELSGLFSVDPELQIDHSNPAALATHYAHLAKVARIISAALVSRASHNAAQGRRFLTAHRMLVAHTLKRSAGIGHVEDEFSESVAELADSFVVMILVTGFLEHENEILPEPKKVDVLFH